MVTEGSDTRIVTPRRLGGRIPLILLSVAALAFPWVFEDAHTQHVLIMIFIYGLMALGWNIIASNLTPQGALFRYRNTGYRRDHTDDIYQLGVRRRGNRNMDSYCLGRSVVHIPVS